MPLSFARLAAIMAGFFGSGTMYAFGAILSGTSSDSMPGWSPSHDEQAAALAAATDFYAATDRGSYSVAYDMLAEVLRTSVSQAAFQESQSEFLAKAGPVVDRHPTAITWTKHEEGGRNPGVFAAIDYVERYQNVDRACSYIVLIEAHDGSGMRVLREQTATLDNATARAIAAKRSPAALDQVWRALTRQYPHCPK